MFDHPRRHPRIPTKTHLRIRGHLMRTRSRHSEVVTLAERGLCIRVSDGGTALPENGAELGFTLTNQQNTRFYLRGTVVWTRRHPDGDGYFGCELDMNSDWAFYQEWVRGEFAELRRYSAQYGGWLAVHRGLPLRALQRGLDVQLAAGGHLVDVLSELRTREPELFGIASR